MLQSKLLFGVRVLLLILVAAIATYIAMPVIMGTN